MKADKGSRQIRFVSLRYKMAQIVFLRGNVRQALRLCVAFVAAGVSLLVLVAAGVGHAACASALRLYCCAKHDTKFELENIRGTRLFN